METKKSSLKSTLTVSLTNYLDAGAIVAGASGLSLWKDYLGLTEGHLGFLNAISANCLGAAVGAIIGGFLADKYGRKFIYTYNMLIYMTGVLFVVFAVNFPMLLAGFLITGISVGVGVPASWTYISESSEINNRGRNIALSQMAWGVGPTVILFLGMLLAPPTAGESGGVLFPLVKAVAGDVEGAALNVWSSRLVFASLFLVAFVAWTLQRQLDESEEWKQSKAEGKKMSTFGSFGQLLTNKINVRTILFLAGMYLTWNLVASVMGFFQPHIFETAGGVSNETANMLCMGQWLIIIIGTFIFSFFVDKTNHRFLLALGLIFGLAAWVLIIGGAVNSFSGLLLFTVLWGLNSCSSVQSFYALWGTELFPAKYRAAAQGIMFFLVRGLSAVWGIIFVYIYGENGEGFTTAAILMAALLVISLVIGMVGAPDTRGKSLEQITRERYGEDL